MDPSDDWRPYTIPYSGDGAVRRSDSTWVPSSQYHSTPLNLAPQPACSSVSSPPAPSAPMDTSATAANDTGGPGHGAAEPYTATGFSPPAGGGDGGGPDIPSVPARDPFAQVGHPRFAAERGPGEGIPCTGGNPPAGCHEKTVGGGWGRGENAPNGQDVKGSK